MTVVDNDGGRDRCRSNDAARAGLRGAEGGFSKLPEPADPRRSSMDHRFVGEVGEGIGGLVRRRSLDSAAVAVGGGGGRAVGGVGGFAVEGGGCKFTSLLLFISLWNTVFFAGEVLAPALWGEISPPPWTAT